MLIKRHGDLQAHEATLVSLLLHEKVAEGEPKKISTDESQVDLGTNINIL